MSRKQEIIKRSALILSVRHWLFVPYHCLNLTRIYGYPYAKDNGASWGACIVQDVRQIDSKPARNTVAECYEAVIKDLNDAIPQLSPEFNFGKMNRWGAMLLLSRAYLYKGDNANALKIAEEAIAGVAKYKYRLME